MTIKPFAIQGADLTLGGVNLQAGTTGVVIPGVTQAASYKIKEVNELDDVDQTETFTPESEIVVIDYVQFQKLSNSQGGNFADFTATTDDEGYIDEIEVNGQGSYTQQEAEDNADNNMYAYNGTDPDRSPFVPQDWIQVPFRPKMTANEVENVGGGNANTGNFTFNADTIANNNDASIVVGGGSPIENVEVNAVDEWGPPEGPGGIWRLFIGDEAYPTLGTTVQIGDTVTTSWGTPITATITDIQQDAGNWQIHVDQDITAGHNDYDTVTFTPASSKIWTFGQDGSLTLPNGMSIDSYGTLGVNAVADIGGDDTRITIDNNGAPPGFSVTTNALMSGPTGTAHTWRFGPDGDLTFPDGSIQTTAYTGTSGATAGGYFLSVGNPSYDSNSFRVVAQDDAYTYYFGNATGFTPGNNSTVIKVDSNGDIVWQSTIDTMDGTVTSAYVFNGTIYIYYSRPITNVLYFVSLLAADGSVDSSISFDQTPDVITSRDTILGTFGGMPAYDATVGSVHFNGDGAKNGLIFGNGMGGNFNSAIEDDDGGDTEYFGITSNSTNGAIYAVGYDSAYSSLVTCYELGSGATWHMNIDCGQVGGTIRATSVDYSNGYIYVVSGEFTDSNNGFLTKMDASTGAVIWQRGMGYGVSGNQDAMGIAKGCVVVDGNGDIVTAWNYGAENSQNNDILIVKFDTDGNMLWQRSLETADNESTDTTQSTEFLTADSEHFYLAITARAGGPGISVGGAIKLPLDGSGTGSYGVWTYQSQSWSVATLDVAGDQIDRTANYTVNNYTIVPSSELNLTVTNSLSDSSIEVIQASSSGNTLVNGSKTFTLNDDGSITFPDGTRQTTAYPGATTYSLHEYNNPTTITTPTVVTIDGIDYAGGEVVQDTAFGVGSSRVTVYADSMFAMIGVNADITTVYYNGETGLDSDGAKTVSSGIENYRGYYAYYNLLAEQGSESSISQIVISKSSTMSGSNRSTDTNNDDFTVSGLSGSDIIVVLNVYWDSSTGPGYSDSIDVAAQAFIDTVLFNDQTARTDINEMKAAFYASSANIKTAIETYEGDLLYSGFEFYRNHQSVRPTGGSGIGAVLEISAVSGENYYSNHDIIVPGVGYRQNDYLNVPGTEFGGTSPANDVSIQVVAVDDNGGILQYYANGTVPSQVWPQTYIVDGDNDQYDIGNFIGTNMTRATATVTLTNEGSGDNPSDPKFIRLTVAYTDKPISLGQWCNLPGNEGCFINWAFPADTTVAELIGNGAQPRVGLKRVIYTNTFGYQGGEETSALVGASNYSGFAIGDTITFRNGEVRTISDFDGDYIEWVGVVPGSTNNSGNNPRYPLTLTTSDYADITKSTVRIKPDAIEADSQDQYMKVYAGFNVVPPNPPLDNLHIHMAGGQENVELFLGTDNNFVSAKEAGNAPAAVNLKSENDINVINTNLRLTRKGSSWVSIYGDGENQNIRNQDPPMGWNSDLAWNVGAVDEFGDYYIGGEANPEADATIAKFSRDGSLIWSKYNDSQNETGWRTDGIAYHNGVVASLVHTDFDSNYVYYKLTEHDSATGVEISTYDIYDPDGDIYAAQMIHHSTLGWVVVGNTYGEGLTSSGLTAIGATGMGIIEIPKAGTLLGGAYPDSSGDWRISGGGFGSFKQQFDQGLGMYANVPVTTVTGVGTGARARVQVIYTSNTYSAFDFTANTGADYVTGDIVKIAGSYLGGGIDGGTSFAATPSSITAGVGTVTLNFDKTTYPTLFTQISSCTWTASYGGSTYTVNSVTDGSSVVGVVVDSTDANNAEVTFLTALGNDMRIVVNASAGAITGIDSSSGVAAPTVLRFDAGYAAGYSGSDFAGGTFTVTRYQNGRAWVWNNSWTKYIEPDDPTTYTRAYSVTENPVTGGLVVGGYTDETIQGGAFVWNLAANGTTSWIKTFGNFPESPGGDNNIITGLAVDQMGQIYAANDVSINRIDANGGSMYRIEPTGMWGAQNHTGISIQLEDDGKEYLYYGMPGMSVWGNTNIGFYLNKFTTNLEVVWGRYMDSYISNIYTNYYDANSPIIFGQGQVTMMGYGDFPVGNYANAILATISTDDEFVMDDANGWVLQNRTDMAWASNNNYILKDYVTAGAQAKTGTVQSDSSGALAWTNYTYQSRVINFNSTTKGIVGVEQIEFVDGGVLDHNPSDIPPSIFLDPQAGNQWAYTLQLSDRGRFILNQTIPNVSECLNLTITVPSNKNVAFPVGTVITLVNASSETAGGYRIIVMPEYFYDGPGSVYAPKIWTTGGYENPSVWGFYGIQTATLMKISTNAWLLTCNNPIDEDD